MISSNTLSISSPKNIVPEIFHPGQVAELIIDQASVGWMGQLHPAWQQKYELTGKTYLYELSMESLINTKDLTITLPSKFPPLRRDISALVDKDIKVGEIVDEVNSQAIDRVIHFYPFDVYQGKGIENNKKSIAFLILMQDTYKTLEDEDINNIVNQVVNILKDKFKASLR